MKVNASSLKCLKMIIFQLGQKKRDKIQITNTTNERETIPTGPMDIKRIIRKYYEIAYVHRFDNLDEIDQLRERTTVL